MKKNIPLIFILGCMLLGGAGNLFSQTPFSDEPIMTTPPTVVNTAPNQGSIPGQIASNSGVASFSRSLWAELHKLYKESVAGRNGKRTFKSSHKAPNEHYLPGFDDLRIEINGDNYCGQFAMSALLKGMGIKTDPQEVYRKTNPAGIFTAPPVIVENLRMSGVDAKMKNKASVNDITKRIDQGKPVIVLVDSGDGTPHWICITGYDTNEKGQIESLRMRDSYWGTSGPHTMAIRDFEKAWKSPFGGGVLGDLLSYSNLLIDNNGKFEPGSSPPIYPGTFSTATEDNLAGGVDDVVTGYKNKSIAQTTGGLAKLLLGLPGAIVGVASNYLDKKSQGLAEWGNKKVKQGGIGNKVLGAGAVIAGGAANVVSKSGKFVADAWSSGASIVGNGIKKIGSWFS